MNSVWLTVSGVVVRGHGIASGQGTSPYPQSTIKIQKPFFKARGLDLSPYFEGTLNISISPRAFTILEPEITFRRVEWTRLHPPEDFSFSRCTVIVGSTSYAGWVYYPHPETKVRHFQNPSIMEVIAPLIDHLKVGDQVEITINTAEISISESNDGLTA
jgi:hypothetical protein